MSTLVRLGEVRERVAAAARRAGRKAEDVEIVAVGKGHPASALREAFEAGQQVFGESRGQELKAKFEQLPAGAEWHFVGPLQTNKVRIVRPRQPCSIPSTGIGWRRDGCRAGERPRPPCCR